MRREERQRSHYSERTDSLALEFPNPIQILHSDLQNIAAGDPGELTFSFKRASDTGLLGRETADGAIDVSGMFIRSYDLYQYLIQALGVPIDLPRVMSGVLSEVEGAVV